MMGTTRKLAALAVALLATAAVAAPEQGAARTLAGSAQQGFARSDG